jgi:uncharacterized lipoprotein YmbA
MRKVLAALMLVCLAGCGGLLSRKQTNRYFSLDRIPPTAPVRTITGAPIAIDVVELPPGFDRRDLVVRKADHQLEIREREQWSSALEPLFLHTLAFDLAARLPEGMVILPGQPIPTGAKRGIDVIVETLAAGPENAVTLDARWTLAGVAHREQIRIDIPSLDGANIADGMSRALATLADRIVARL